MNNISTDKISQEISKPDSELIYLLPNDENVFKFSTGLLG